MTQELKEKMSKLCHKALAKYGDMQVYKCVEELIELADALMKRRQSRCVNQDVLEEIADVQITLYQMCLHYGFSNEDIEVMLEKKLDKMEKEI